MRRAAARSWQARSRHSLSTWAAAGRDAVEKGGLVRDPEARALAVLAVARDLAERGVAVIRVAPSPIAGREGNREIFVHARKGAPAMADDALAAAVRAAAR